MPSDGQLDPSQLTYALAGRGPRRRRPDPHPHPGPRIDTDDGRHGRRVTRVRTDRGDVECEVVVDCGGMYAAEIARMVGVRVPIVPMSHQYVVTEAMPAVAQAARERPLPSLRDPDLLVYYRQEVDGLVVGGYERDPAPFTATAARYDAIPADFNARLLPDDWDRLEEICRERAAAGARARRGGVRRVVNGPEAFTPDNEFCLGETEVAGFFVAAGFCAHGIAGAGGIGKVVAEWVVAGEPEFDVWHMDIRRFGPRVPLPVVHARPHRRDLCDLLRHRLPGPAALVGAPAAHVPGVRVARGARRRVRREGRLGARRALRPPPVGDQGILGGSPTPPRDQGIRGIMVDSLIPLDSLITGSREGAAPTSRAGGRGGGPGGTGRRRRSSSTWPPARTPVCSTSRRSPSSPSPAPTPAPSWSGSATTTSPGASATSPTRSA